MGSGAGAVGRAAPQPPKSPFFAPATPSVAKSITTPGGTRRVTKIESGEAEHKSTMAGATSNLINAIVGAGIVGIPFAVRELGLWAGVFMVAFCAVLTDKSLRLLVETAKHIDVPTYEMLCEASFGKPGFITVLVAMFIMAYGAMLSYLMIVKDTLPVLLGVSSDDVTMKRAVLTVTSLVIILPLSCQRDMADLAKTSRLNVAFDCVMVLIVAAFSPIQQSVSDAGGIWELALNSGPDPNTFFIGLGVLSFAFVCQHSAFIIAGSLDRPTRVRWGTVTRNALMTCGVLATLCGVSGYLGFLDDTRGNILNNFHDGLKPSVVRAANVARGLLCTTMFFVYPMESFVARHVCVVLLFRGRRAHEGEDHSVLARKDRRIAVTTALYLLALVPALLCRDLGAVLASTGALGGSTLSYIGPGVAYLGVHGGEFLDFVGQRWGESWISGKKKNAAASCCSRGGNENGEAEPLKKSTSAAIASETSVAPTQEDESDGRIVMLFKCVSWYILLMPAWCAIASIGRTNLARYEEEEALKSPHPSRLGKVKHHAPGHRLAGGTGHSEPGVVQLTTRDRGLVDDDFEHQGIDLKPLVRSDSLPLVKKGNILPPKSPGPTPSYGTPMTKGLGSSNRAIGAAIIAAQKQGEDDVEDDPQDDLPSVVDFVVAIGYIVFGVVAMAAGLFSIFV